MSEEHERETEEHDEAEEPRDEKPRYEYVPYETTPEDELYAFREALSSPVQPQIKLSNEDVLGIPVAPPDNKRRKYLIALAAVGGLVVAMLVVVLLNQGLAPPPIVDLGPSEVMDSGLSGDFVARWAGKPGYVFYVNPISADNLAGFAAVAANPPRQISFNIHLKDGSGVTVCEKEIIFPFKAPVDGSAVPTEGPPERTMDGEEISYERGDQGKIARLEMQGPMNCPKDLYQRIAAWDFASTYPIKADQQDWLLNLERGGGKSQPSSIRKRQASAPQKLSGPIDGDDVIVGDNPSHGTVLTSAGREFFVGPGGLSSHGQGWGFFPAPIHFHCDVKASCTLTRPGAVNAVPARLIK